MGLYGGQGIFPSLKGNVTNIYALAPGQAQVVPAGWYFGRIGKYHNLQQIDPITGIWRNLGDGGANSMPEYFYSDGQNVRVANTTGCAVGALLTNAGSGYTSVPVVTASAGNSVWKAIVGGAVNTAITVTNGGNGYAYAPAVQFSAPPAGGIQATGYATVSGGVVTGVTVVDQGAGYNAAPQVVFVNDQREGINGVSTGYGAAAVAVLTGAGTVTGVLCLDPGNAGLTAVPTLSFSGGGGSAAAATAIMDWAITAMAVTTAGGGLAGTTARVSAEDAFPATASAYANPSMQSNLVKTRSADLRAAISSGGVTAAGLIIADGGRYTSVPTPLVLATASVVTTAPVVTFTMGGLSDVTALQPT